MTPTEWKRKGTESEEQYLWRLGQAKDSGLLEAEWSDIALWMNEQFRRDETEYRESSAYRKPYQQAKRFYESGVFNTLSEEEYISSIREAKKELEKEKRQFEDQRREFRKCWTEEARFDNLVEKMVGAVKSLNDEAPLIFEDRVEVLGINEAVLCFADWHYGLVTDNIWNTYNTEICRARVKTVVEKTIFHLKTHHVRKLHIMLLGDAAHGAIHNSCRVASEEAVCDQLIHVSEIIAEAINELSQYVESVDVHATYGNHLRTIQNKHDSIHSDNMEKIIGWWLKQRLQNNLKVNIIESDYYEFVFLNVCGYNIVGAHGDLEKFKQFGLIVNTIFSKRYGKSIDYTVSADKHHIEEFEQMGIESILVRSLCGSDEYANDNRLYSAPGQTLMIFNPQEGRQCTYNMKVE